MQYDGAEARFASVELAYHAAKMLYLVGSTQRPDLGLELARGGKHGNAEGAAQKALGSRAAFAKLGVALDIAAWNAAAPRIMRTLIEARAAADATFVAHCKDFVSRGITIRHFARGKPEKGGFYRQATGDRLLVGRDMLGPLLVEVGSIAVAKP